MAGISSKAANTLVNKKKFNAGSELQSEEFSDGSGLEWYDVDARFYDPQLGRFMQVDPKPDEGDQESYQPYQYALDNPISYNDPDGELWNLVIGAVIGAAVDYGSQVVSNLAEGKSISESLTQVDGKSILKSAAIGAVTSGASAFVAKAGSKVVTSVLSKTVSTSKTTSQVVDKAWKAKIISKAQVTGTIAKPDKAHAIRSMREAIKAAKNPNVEKVYMNRGINKAANTKIKPNTRADITVVNKSGRIDLIEVPSKTDNPADLMNRMQNTLSQLPVGQRGAATIVPKQ